MPNPKKININLLDVKQSGSFTKSDWNTLYELYAIEAKDIIFTSKTKTLKDSNNDYKWTHLSFNGIINGEQKDPKMPKNNNYATKADIKEIKDSLKNYATKDDIQEIKDSLKNYATKDDINRITNDIQEIKDSLKNYATKDDIKAITNDIQVIKDTLILIVNSIGEIKKDISLIKECPTIKKELNPN